MSRDEDTVSLPETVRVMLEIPVPEPGGVDGLRRVATEYHFKVFDGDGREMLCGPLNKLQLVYTGFDDPVGVRTLEDFNDVLQR